MTGDRGREADVVDRLTLGLLVVPLVLAGLVAAPQVAVAHEDGAYSSEGSIGLSLSDWMMTLPDELPLSMMSIPGTHDSGAYVTGGDYVETQSMDIRTQLASGIRALDVRVGADPDGGDCGAQDTLYLFHGPVCQETPLSSFLGDVRDFLADNPGEFVVMRLKKDAGFTNDDPETPDEDEETQGGSDGFITVLEAELDAFKPMLFRVEDADKARLKLGGAGQLTLGQLRGRVLVFDDFPKELDEDTATTFPWENKKPLYIQDKWGLLSKRHLPDKWYAVRNQLLFSDEVARSPDQVFVNFLSGSQNPDLEEMARDAWLLLVTSTVLVADYTAFPYFFASGHSDPSTGAPRLLTGWTRGVIDTCSDTDLCIDLYPSVNCFLGTCSVAYEGVNTLAHDRIDALIDDRTGIVFADFPGPDLIQSIIALNTSPDLSRVPQVSLSTDVERVTEGQQVELTGSLSVAETEGFGHLVEIDWGDRCTAPGGCHESIIVLQDGDLDFAATHVYTDDDPSGTAADVVEITAEVRGLRQLAGVGSVAVDVENAAPSLDSLSLGGSTPPTGPPSITIDEGETVTLTGDIVDPGTREDHTIVVDWGDGTSSTVRPAAGATVFTARHTYADNRPGAGSPYRIGLSVSDDDGGTFTVPAGERPLVAVNNMDPTVTVAVERSTGTSVRLTGSINDPGINDAFSVSVDWGDGQTSTKTVAARATAFNLEHSYTSQPSVGTKIAVTVDDGDGGRGSSSATVPDLGLAPPFTARLSSSGGRTAEGNPTLLRVDVEADQVSARDIVVVWGDGTLERRTLQPTEPSTTFTHVYLDDPAGTGIDEQYAIAVTVTSATSGAGSTITLPVAVGNIAPEVDAEALPATVVEGSEVTVKGSFTDDGEVDTHEVVVDWDDPNDAADSRYVVTPGEKTFEFTHTYADDGQSPGNGTPADGSTIEVSVIDDDGGVGTSTHNITVENAPPTLDVDPTPDTVSEGGELTVTGTVDDAGADDVRTVTIDWDDPGDDSPTTLELPAGVTAFSAVHTYIDDADGGSPDDPRTIEVTASDDDAGASIVTREVTIEAGEPEIGEVALLESDGALLDASDLLSGTEFPTMVTFADPGTSDSHEVSVDFGDGTVIVGAAGEPTDGATLLLVQAEGLGVTVVRHTYTRPGQYDLTVTVTDDDGLQATSKRTVVVAADEPSPPPAPDPTVRCGGKIATIVGTPGRDIVTGTRGNDVIAALSGNDVVRGRGGRDIICLGPGSDRASGGKGNDRILGGKGNDRIDGGKGNDRILGGKGNDRLAGQAGKDRVLGGDGNDRIRGNGAADTLFGNRGKDRMIGGPARDRCLGGPGKDRATSCEIRRSIP